MLPEAAQARKAIWDAVDENSGKRRIDIAFPEVVRQTTREQEMFIRFRNGSTWQVVGSDNFDSLVGSPPVGVVFSEYALANPRAWDMLRPILRNNGGWGAFVSTPRGRNHFKRLCEYAEAEQGEAAAEGRTPEWFAQTLTVEDTQVIGPAAIEAERRELASTKGDDIAEAIIQQEYYCSWNSPLVGAIYGKEMMRARGEGRVGDYPWIPELPVYTAFDLGSTDDTAIWFFQIRQLPDGKPRVRCIDCFSAPGQDTESVAHLLKDKGYGYGGYWVPHDAVPKTFAAPRSALMQFSDLGIKARMVPRLSLQDGIQSARKTLPDVEFDASRCERGIDALEAYEREWDEERADFREQPRHNWASHLSDSFRYMSIVWKTPKTTEFRPPEGMRRVKLLSEMTFNEVMWGKETRSARMVRRI